MAIDATRYYENVQTHGLSSTHKQVIAWVPPNSRVLELGCSTGYIGKILRESKGCQVTGIEIDARAAIEARKNGLTVLEGSLESAEFRHSISGKFDVVIAADVLEHLADPAPTLEHFKTWLAPGGFAIVAVPNIATWSIRKRLFFHGDFEYTETGILDRTHLHHFTWYTLHKLIAKQRWIIRDTMVEGWEFPLAREALFDFPSFVMSRTGRWTNERNLLSRALLKHTFTWAGKLYTLGERFGNSLIRAIPNFSAPHVALTLFPQPSSSQGSNGSTTRSPS